MAEYLVVEAQVVEMLTNNKNTPIPFYKLTIDPDSYVRSVLNCRIVVYLVANKHIAMVDGEDEYPAICLAPENRLKEDIPCNSGICSLTREFWRALVEKYDIETPMLPVPPENDDDADIDEKYILDEKLSDEDDDDFSNEAAANASFKVDDDEGADCSGIDAAENRSL